MINVHPAAKIGRNVVISPFTTIAGNVEIGDDCWIGPNVTIFDYIKIGRGCRIFPGAVLGAIPQDLKFRGEESWVEIGENTTIREYATVHRGTAASGKCLTSVGHDCLLMAYTHIAHDCRVGNHCIISSFSGLAGEVVIDDWAIIGGGTMIHQFCHIGEHVMIGGDSGISKDVPPFALTGHNPPVFGGVNLVGMRRRGFSNEEISEISGIYKIIYNSGLNVSDACERVREVYGQSTNRDKIINFIAASVRGIIR